MAVHTQSQAVHTADTAARPLIAQYLHALQIDQDRLLQNVAKHAPWKGVQRALCGVAAHTLQLVERSNQRCGTTRKRAQHCIALLWRAACGAWCCVIMP